MNLISKVALWLILSAFLAFGARAQEVRTGNTLICGTADHVKNFVRQNQDLGRALAAINDATGGDSSCLVAPIAFVTGKQVERFERGAATYVVTEILIVGVATPYGMLATEPSVVYTVLKVHEEAA